jgi:Flp pilus assembly pilin Flp
VSVQRLRRLLWDPRGQTTAEYSLVLLVAGLVVGVFAAFVKGGALAQMFKQIVSGLVQRAGG